MTQRRRPSGGRRALRGNVTDFDLATMSVGAARKGPASEKLNESKCFSCSPDVTKILPHVRFASAEVAASFRSLHNVVDHAPGLAISLGNTT